MSLLAKRKFGDMESGGQTETVPSSRASFEPTLHRISSPGIPHANNDSWTASKSNNHRFQPQSRFRRTEEPGSDEPYSHYTSLSEPDSGRTSGRASPVNLGSAPQSSRRFQPNASIVLIGIRGTGKSSLAIILSTALRRRLIEADRYFYQVTGLTRAEYKKTHDPATYRERDAQVMGTLLSENREGCVISCGPSSMEWSGQRLLREYTKTNPVVHITRDAASIQQYIKAWDEEKVRRFLEISGPLYRACSNLEFFNVSDTSMSTTKKNGDQRKPTTTPFLTLKHVERDFLRFMSLAMGNVADQKHHAAYPLSLLPLESRPYTYAISVSLSTLTENSLDIEELETTTDAFELQIDVPHPSADSQLSPSDADKVSQTLASVRRNVIVPVIYHVASVKDAGTLPSQSSATSRSEERYIELLEHGLRLAPDYLTVDLNYSDAAISRIVTGKGSAKIMAHFAASTPPPGGWDGDFFFDKYDRAIRLGCDIVRLSQPAISMDDNFAVQRFTHRIQTLKQPRLPIIAFNTGPLGRLSCCFNPILTPVTHPSLNFGALSRTAPCLTARAAQEALYASFTVDPMKFYVFGGAVTYSLSPAMHNAAFKECGMPHLYQIHQASSLREVNALVEDPNFGGLSVSLPFKTEVIALVHSLSPHARVIGAVNTLIPIRKLEEDTSTPSNLSLHRERNRAGPVKALHGDNTDWIGIRTCIRRGLSPANAVRPHTTGLVIGAGGMARASIYSMIQLGVQNIFLYNRTLSTAQKLAHHYNRQGSINGSVDTTVHVIESVQDPWPADFRQPTMAVCCIPTQNIVGQPPANFEMPTQWLESPTGGIVVELAYKPLDTPLVKQIRALAHRGWVISDGLDVLPEQGFAQFEIFTGRRAPRRLMREIVLKEYCGEEGQYDPRALQSRIESLDGKET